MKDLTTGFTETYTWSVIFGKDEASIGLYHKSDSAMLAEILVCNRWVEFVLLHLPGGYRLWSKILSWTTTKEERVLTIPATKEMLAVIAPDERWLWDEDYVEEEDPSGTV